MTDVAAGQAQAEGGLTRGNRAKRIGMVVSDKGEKTIKVVFTFTKKHRKYHKYIRRSTTLHAHDEKNEAKIGDKVEVTSCRRISKTKSWRLSRILDSL